jgi:GT2 family glycosyltransferase
MGLRASIIIPTFNRRPLLMATLSSLAHQTVPPDRYEVVVGIDGSSDDTVESLRASQFPFALIWVWQENRGTAAAVNHAAAIATNDVLIFLGDDQRASAALVATHLDAQARHGDVLVQGYYPNAPECRRSGASLVYARSVQGLPDVFRAGGARRWHLWGANFSLRRSTWQRLGGYDESFGRMEDTDLGIRIAKLGIPSLFEPEALSYHLHSVTYEGFRRYSFNEGRALVRLARKHALPLSVFSGASIESPVERGLRIGWRHAPRLMDLVGRGLTLCLRAADGLAFQRAQVAAARLVRRVYKVGGIATNPGRWELHGGR